MKKEGGFRGAKAYQKPTKFGNDRGKAPYENAPQGEFVVPTVLESREEGLPKTLFGVGQELHIRLTRKFTFISVIQIGLKIQN